MLAGLVRQCQETLQSDRRHLLAQFQLIGLARKVVGVGSDGTRAWILLFEGVDQNALDPGSLHAAALDGRIVAQRGV